MLERMKRILRRPEQVRSPASKTPEEYGLGSPQYFSACLDACCVTREIDPAKWTAAVRMDPAAFGEIQRGERVPTRGEVDQLGTILSINDREALVVAAGYIPEVGELTQDMVRGAVIGLIENALQDPPSRIELLFLKAQILFAPKPKLPKK